MDEISSHAKVLALSDGREGAVDFVKKKKEDIIVAVDIKAM